MITVVIPSRNRVENLEHTLTALINQTISKDKYEVVISDDNSTDNTFSLYEKFKNEISLKYVNNNKKPHTWNASVPRNLGACLSDPLNKILVFIDSDVVLPDRALEFYLEDYEMNEERVVVAPYDFMQKDNRTVRERDVRYQNFEDHDVSDLCTKATDGLACFGGNIMFPKKIFWEMGGYDRNTHIGLEDGEMGIRLWKKGVPISYDKRIYGIHRWHETPSDRFPPDLRSRYVRDLNMKHFQTDDPDYGLIELTRDAYKDWGINPSWQPPAEWQ